MKLDYHVTLDNQKRRRSYEFGEVHVDIDQKEAEVMVRKTGQMGVPVTAILFEDGEEEYIVGFDKTKLEQILNVK